MSTASGQTIQLVAGNGTPGFAGNGRLDDFAQFDTPLGLSGDSTGALYIADTGNNRIRSIHDLRDSLVTVAGTGTAGFSGDAGAATSAQLNAPWDVFVAGSGTLYVADTGNHRVRRITPAGVISTIAGTGTAGFSGDGSTATSAQLKSPTGVYVAGGVIYIADQGNHRIRAISGTTISTIAGTDSAGSDGDGGAATSAQLSSPTDIYADTSGTLYIADTGNHRIRAIDSSDSTITTVAGTGSSGYGGDGDLATHAQLAFPRSVYVDTAGNLYITDRFNHRLRRVNTNGVITTLAGDDSLGYSGNAGAANRSRLAAPSGVWLHGEQIYFTDAENNRVRWIDTDNVSSLSGTSTSGPGRQVSLLRVSFTGDGVTGVKGVALTISDLSTATGLEVADFSEFQLYESADTTLSSDDTLLGTRAADEVTLGSVFDIQTTPTSVPSSDTERHYIVAARFSTTAQEGHGLRVGFATGGISTSIGGHGNRIAASDANSITLDVVATTLVFTTQPEGVISGNALITQPVVTAVDDSGYVDEDFTDVVSLSLSAGSAGTLLQTTATADSGVATFSGIIYIAGGDEENFGLVADDEAGGAEGDLATVTSNTLSANAANDAPVVSAFSFTITEDDSVRVPLASMVSDVDDSLSTLQFTFVASNTDATLDGLDLLIKPHADFFGADTLIIIATDPFGATASGTSLLTVRPVNDVPTFDALSVNEIDEDDTLVIDLTQLVRDSETPFGKLTWQFVPADELVTSFDATTGLLSVHPLQDANGAFRLRVSVTDEDFAITSLTDTIHVAPVNDAPAFLLSDTTMARSDTLQIPLAQLISDAEDESTVLTLEILSALGLEPTLQAGSLRLQGTSGFSGNGWIALRASDPQGAATTDTLQVAIFTANPQAPVITTLPVLDVEIDDTLIVDLSPYISDPDHDPANLSATVASPAQGQAQIEHLVLTYVAESTPGTVDLILTVTDPDGEATSALLQINIVGTKPLLSEVPEELEIGLGGLQLFLDNFVSGDDADLVTWSAQTIGDVDVVIDLDHRLLRVTPRNDSREGGEVILQAITPNKSATDTIRVSVVNATPVVTLPNLFVNAGESAQLALDGYVSDDEGATKLTWTGITLQAGLQITINPAVRAATLTSQIDASGEVSVVLTATDAQGASGLDTMTVTILGIDDGGTDTTIVDTGGTNTAPRVGPFAVLELFSGGQATLQLSDLASDDDPLVELNWSLEAGAGIEALLDEAQTELRISTLEGFSGSTTLRLTATDAFGARGIGTMAIEISPLVAQPEPGDFGRDGRIDLDDFFLFADHLGLTRFHAGWDPIYDLNDDGRIDFDDFFLFADIFDTVRLSR
ncbi:MAG: hypothetical protein HN712_21190 [Gemmatimonadetes bacterium]|nr:hypothetical protein [Gemmatimonadota bacterium]MBT7862844.1 hypothetical protein [Gemmatimonadota bacterium]